MENTFTKQEIDSIVCDIFGCNDSPVEEVSLSKIFADVENFDDASGIQQQEESLLFESLPHGIIIPARDTEALLRNYETEKMLSDHIDSILFEFFGRSQIAIREIFANIDYFDYEFGAPWFNWVWYSELIDHSENDGYPEVFTNEYRAKWDQFSEPSSIGSDYGLYNLFNQVPRSEWSHSRSSTGSLISNPDAHPLFAFIDPVTWPDSRKRSKTLSYIFTL